MAIVRRVVIDPNVLVSAAITPRGTAAAVLDLIDAGLVVAVVSPQLLTELDGVLRRDKFRRWLTLEAASAFVTELERLADLIEDPVDAPPLSQDPDDDYLLALARSTGADALVSGDPDLTDLYLDGLVVLTPRQFLEDVASNLDQETDDEL